MKKKLATLLMFVLIFLCSFTTGCNLWRSNGYANLSAIVATSGDIQITREELITAYNNSGYYYDQYYGLSRKEAIERTIESLVNRKYMLKYIDELALKDSRYKLTPTEKYKAIKETWDYIDKSIASIVEQTRKDLGLNKEDLSTDDSSSNSSDYKPKDSYTRKFVEGSIKTESGTQKIAIKTVVVDNTEYQPKDEGDLPDVYKDYHMNLKSSSEDYKRLVWNRYITMLKINQSSYKYDEMSDEAVFEREINKTYITNIENAKLKKYEDIYKNNFGLDHDPDYEENGEKVGLYYVNNQTLQDMLDYYNRTYNSNKELYNLSKKNSNILSESEVANSYYNLITNTSNREEYLYYGEPGEDEELLTCIHILVKLSDAQTNKIKEIDENIEYKELYGDDGKTIADYLKEQERSANKTYANLREYDSDGKATETGKLKSVTELYEEIRDKVYNISARQGSQEYLEEVVKIFDEYIYTYNQDTGIQNAKFDYIVGTKTSSMVASFTEVVRNLAKTDANGNIITDKTTVQAEYNKDVTLEFPFGTGYAGAMSAPFYEEASNYSGYHIVLYTGKLSNIPANSLNINNIFEELNKQKTCVSYGQTMFEFVYDKVVKDNYNKHQTNKVNSIMTHGIKLNSSNYSDLLNS